MKEKTLNQYKAEAFALYVKNYAWQFKAIEDMLKISTSSIYYSNQISLLNRWWSISYELKEMSFKLDEALESDRSKRAYKRSCELYELMSKRVEQQIKFNESKGK